MAKAKTNIDKFCQRFYATVTESAINTLTFSEINTNIPAGSRLGWILHRLDYFFPVGLVGELVTGADTTDIALCGSSKITALDLSDATVYDVLRLNFHIVGAAAGALYSQPISSDFTRMPEGGLLIYPNELYLGMKSTGFAATYAVQCRGYFSYVDITKAEAFDLVEMASLVR